MTLPEMSDLHEQAFGLCKKLTEEEARIIHQLIASLIVATTTAREQEKTIQTLRYAFQSIDKPSRLGRTGPG